MQGMYPSTKAGLESHRLKPIKNSFERIMRGDSIGQAEKFLQPLVSAASKGFGLLPVLAATDGPTDGYPDDVDKQVLLAAVDARVLEFAEVLIDRQAGLSHDSP